MSTSILKPSKDFVFEKSLLCTTNVNANSTKQVILSITQMTKDGYIPIFAILTGSGYTDYITINQGGVNISGDKVVLNSNQIFVGNWSNSNLTGVQIEIRILWMGV